MANENGNPLVLYNMHTMFSLNGSIESINSKPMRSLDIFLSVGIPISCPIVILRKTIFLQTQNEQYVLCIHSVAYQRVNYHDTIKQLYVPNTFIFSAASTDILCFDTFGMDLHIHHTEIVVENSRGERYFSISNVFKLTNGYEECYNSL